MRKIIFLLFISFIFILSACTRPETPLEETGTISSITQVSENYLNNESIAENEIVQIKEKMFITQLNDIYINRQDYIGKTISYEGMFTQYTWDEMNTTYYLVYRRSPGCCGADGQAGLEVIWPDGSEKAYPNENDWCEVVGTLESYNENGENFLQIRLDSLIVKEDRGEEFVKQ